VKKYIRNVSITAFHATLLTLTNLTQSVRRRPKPHRHRR
jgi:hypothetical protein